MVGKEIANIIRKYLTRNKSETNSQTEEKSIKIAKYGSPERRPQSVDDLRLCDYSDAYILLKGTIPEDQQLLMQQLDWQTKQVKE